MVVLSKVDFDTRWAQIVYSEPNGGEAENCGWGQFEIITIENTARIANAVQGTI